MSYLHRLLLCGGGGGIVAGCIASTHHHYNHHISSDAAAAAATATNIPTPTPPTTTTPQTTHPSSQKSWLSSLWPFSTTTTSSPIPCLPCSLPDTPGTVLVWGGQFGRTPLPLHALGGDIVRVAVGDGFGAAVDSSGKTRLFHHTASGLRVQPLPIPDVVDLAIREQPREIILLTTHGRVHRARVHDDADDTRPVDVLQGALKRARVRAVACGKRHCVAVTDVGEAVSWGHGADGQLGRAVGDEDAEIPGVMQLGGVKVARASCGDAHTLLLACSGRVYAAGSDVWAQLGVCAEPWVAGHEKRCATPRQSALLDGVIVCDVAGGGGHSAALAVDGTLFSCGFNRWGQLGHHNYSSFAPPAAVADVALKGARVAAGRNHTVVVDVEGGVWSIGGNERGQLGNGGLGPSMKWRRVRYGKAEDKGERGKGGGRGRGRGRIRACRVWVQGDVNAVIVAEEDDGEGVG